jgi:hypothetical protein
VQDIPLRRDKEVVIDALLLDAGVPMESLAMEGRTRAVFGSYLLVRQSVVYQEKLGAQYDLGKQFQLSGSISDALQIADAIIKVVDAPSREGLSTAHSEAQKLLKGTVRAKNLAFLQHRV